MKTTLLIAVVTLVLATFSYKLLPFRKTGRRHPLLAVLPKYKKLISASASDQTLQEKLVQYGFIKQKQIPVKQL